MTTRGFDPKAIAGKVPPPARRVEVLVVGAGPAGVAAAIEAAQLAAPRFCSSTRTPSPRD